MSLTCPDCQQPLVQTGDAAHCANCNRDWTLQACCPDCHQSLEVLKACGAVDYFCRNGHGLISRKRVEFVPR